ncbi:Hsp20/alpha crystallin family protein [Halorientalis regularis]|jgi:HSP20 family protein|uniref:Molecular chaperone IbpA, HSP20 family n=1 Tax=Halorientalis regularis TaxID=660518 RepID=A0A1G7IXL6_9EURY|nr:Hsp20 family protein [Halorientalis regularis]SDF17294.1 Molecular chaperone IbpA, HSP20 family [Halorientalis regularis]
MIRELGRSIGNTVMETVGRAASRVQERRPLPVDLLESEDAFLAVFDAPGATSSDVQVRFDDNAVEVRIDRFRDFYEGFEMLVPGRGLALDGRVTLPTEAAVDPTGADATLRRNGTLEVRIPKHEDASEMHAEEESTAVEDVETAEESADDTDAATDEPDASDA